MRSSSLVLFRVEDVRVKTGVLLRLPQPTSNATDPAAATPLPATKRQRLTVAAGAVASSAHSLSLRAPFFSCPDSPR